MLSHVVLQFLFSVCTLTILSQVVLQFLFQLAFDHAFTDSITVYFSVCSLTLLLLQFLFQLAFDRALSGCIIVTLLFDYT